MADDRTEPQFNAVHVYVSTYCQHAQHDSCRQTCKVCNASCRCVCHVDIVFDFTKGEVRRA